MAYADWPAGRFQHTGEVKAFCGRSFCPNCGTRLFHLHDDGSAEVLLGALDDGPSDLTPTHEGWIIRREHWLVAVAQTEQFERDVR
jgi:hypothetical protein